MDSENESGVEGAGRVEPAYPPSQLPKRGDRHSHAASSRRIREELSAAPLRSFQERREGWGPAVPEKTRFKKVQHYLARALVLLFAGLLFTTSATLRPPEGSRYDSDLNSLVSRKQVSVNDIKASNELLYNQIDELLATVPDQPRLATWERTRVNLQGPGVVVTLEDAPVVEPLPDGVKADDLVIHQQDIEVVFNALWSGGAEVLSVQGHQVRADSKVACVGNVINIDGRLYSPPYEIGAIGPVQEMRDALAQNPQIAIIQEYVARFGLGYSVRDETNLVVHAAERQPVFNFVKVAENDSNQ
ncbi:MAG: DUF881 domain-containing protein [Actinomycetaceae bacterium]|nr:DUF881 domain-containing protein [Actinomycetaceae bacterium]